MIPGGHGPPPRLENGSFPGPAPPELKEEHGNGNKFFTIIHSQIIRDRKLAIPMKFLRKFGKDLSDFAILKAPRGPTWCVELKKGHSGDVWFGNGWQEFVDYHSISPTDFLMFRYDGDSQFHVLIFDVSGSEIDYRMSPHPNNSQEHDISHRRRSSINTKVKKETVQLEEEEEEEEEEDPDDQFLYPDERRPRPVARSSINTKVKKETVQLEEEEEEEEEDPISESFVSRKSRTVKPVTENAYPRKKSTQEINGSQAMQAAKEFKTENPFFTVPIAPAYVNHCFMSVPSTFGKRLLRDNTRDWIKVRVSDGRSWFIKCIASKTENRFRLCKGLTAFFGENDVKTGDVCVFELIIEDDAAILHAHIFH